MSITQEPDFSPTYGFCRIINMVHHLKPKKYALVDQFYFKIYIADLLFQRSFLCMVSGEVPGSPKETRSHQRIRSLFLSKYTRSHPDDMSVINHHVYCFVYLTLSENSSQKVYNAIRKFILNGFNFIRQFISNST